MLSEYESDDLRGNDVFGSAGTPSPVSLCVWYVRKGHPEGDTGGDATMITKAEAMALRVTWKARAGTLTCLHHYLFLERINSKRSTKNYLCMDCGASVVKRFTPSAENGPTLSSARWAGKEKYQKHGKG
jgi:hypothetical protein